MRAVSRHWPGFSLLELLLVVVLMVVLLGMVLPVINRARRLAKDVNCRSNLRQWGQATHLYSTENEDWLPKDGSPNGASTEEGWYVELPVMLGIPPYASMPWRTNPWVDPGKTLWLCPANTRRSSGVNLFHYALNQHVSGRGQGRQVKLSSIPHPAETIWMFDNGRAAAVARQNNVHTNLHRQGAHFLFLDGHVQWFGNRDYWDFGKGVGRLNHPELRWIP